MRTMLTAGAGLITSAGLIGAGFLLDGVAGAAFIVLGVFAVPVSLALSLAAVTTTRRKPGHGPSRLTARLCHQCGHLRQHRETLWICVRCDAALPLTSGQQI